MAENKADRRIQRTRRVLKSALVKLIKERGYDAITIQDITEQANVGRTTFYLHYQSKEALLLDHHAEVKDHFKLISLSREQLLQEEPQPEIVAFLKLLSENRNMYFAIRAAKDADLIVRGIREQMTSQLQASLKAIFAEQTPLLPMEVLTEYVAGAQLSLINWWMTNRTPYEAHQLARMLHQLQRSVILDAYGLTLLQSGLP